MGKHKIVFYPQWTNMHYKAKQWDLFTTFRVQCLSCFLVNNELELEPSKFINIIIFTEHNWQGMWKLFLDACLSVRVKNIHKAVYVELEWPETLYVINILHFVLYKSLLNFGFSRQTRITVNVLRISKKCVLGFG